MAPRGGKKKKKKTCPWNKRDGGHYRNGAGMEPDDKHRNKGSRLEHDLDSLFFENEDEYWPQGWWTDVDEEGEESDDES